MPAVAGVFSRPDRLVLLHGGHLDVCRISRVDFGPIGKIIRLYCIGVLSSRQGVMTEGNARLSSDRMADG